MVTLATSDGLSDESLLAGLGAGDRRAATAFVRRFERRVYGLALTVVGDPAEAADQIRSLAADFDVDEVMISPVGSAHRGTYAASSPAREDTLELLAKELL